jgi:flagellar hook protein FlgE
MSLSSSLNAGITGLASNSSRLATISDNISNSSTHGYKRVSTEFHSLVVAGTYTAGGVRTSVHRSIDQQGTLVSSGNSTDLAVGGRGFLPVASQSEIASGDGFQMKMTSTGSFRLDQDGHLRTPSNLVLLGWPAEADGTIPQLSRSSDSGLEAVKVNLNAVSGEPTTAMTLGVNLPATETDATATGDPQQMLLEYFDNLGAPQSLTATFTPTIPGAGQSNEWTVELYDSTSAAVVGEYTLTFDDSRADGGTLASVATVSGGAYDPVTGSVILTVAGGPIEMTFGTIGDTSGMTQLGDRFAPVNLDKDGAPVGNMINLEIDSAGYVYALYDTGITRRIYQIPLVDLPNPNGMVALDNQTYIPSSESGEFFLWDAGTGPTGEMVPFAREESTTDVAEELTNMIQTQRAYSSNAKVIQTVDEMLQETTNIKR